MCYFTMLKNSSSDILEFITAFLIAADITRAASVPVSYTHLEDEDYQDAIHNMICNENVNAEYAVSITGDNFADMFANMDDDYMRARSADVKDISNRLVSNLSGEEQPDWENTEPSIIVADDLTPSETVQMDKNKILAFVLVHGSANSHTAILARMMNIPALIGVPIELESLPKDVYKRQN